MMSSLNLPPTTDVTDVTAGFGTPTDLPDSLDDAARIAGEATAKFASLGGSIARCRVDFDTSVGDETFTPLKRSTEFMQKFVTALSYSMIPGMQEMRQSEMMALVQARAELTQMMANPGAGGAADAPPLDAEASNLRRGELMRIVQNGGRVPPPPPAKGDDPAPIWTGPKMRIYFPDEGSSALAQRDWNVGALNPAEEIIPPCVEFSSCGGVQQEDTSQDVVIIYFCPRASEAEFVEATVRKMEAELGDQLMLTVFVNPVLVDMTITGFGMAGRMLRERLIDPLMPTYYLRTLSWGALTRVWPRQFTVWQEDTEREGGYRMIKSMDRLPSNPEVEDIYDYENGIASDPEASKGFGLLNAIADFANGMMRL